MDFIGSINLGVNRSKLEAAKELSKRDRRYKDILSIVIRYCENISFINENDKISRNYKFEWLCSVVDIHLTAIMLNDQIEENDIPMDFEMIQEDNEIKAQKIVESIALYLVAASPKPNLKNF